MYVYVYIYIHICTCIYTINPTIASFTIITLYCWVRLSFFTWISKKQKRLHKMIFDTLL